MKLSFKYSDKINDGILKLHKDESILSDHNYGDFDLLFGKFSFGIAIDKETRRLINFIGYSSDFKPTKNLQIPSAKKGEIYIDSNIEGDGGYYPKEYNFNSDGVYDVNTGWYRVGEAFTSGEVVEIAKDTFINLRGGVIKAIYFKPQPTNGNWTEQNKWVEQMGTE